MKALIVVLSVLLTGVNLYAQKTTTAQPDSGRKAPVRTFNPNDRRNGYETYQSTSQIVGSGPYTMVNTIDHRYEGLRGSPYFSTDWNKGQIEMVAGQNYRDVPIKFDAFRQQLLLLRPWAGRDSIIVHADQVKSFQFNDAQGQTYVFRHLLNAHTDDEALKNGYFLVLYQDKTALLKRVSKSFRSADYKNPYSTGTRYDEFRSNSSYYVLNADQSLTKVKLAEKSLIDALPDQQSDLKTRLKALDLRVKTEADAVALLKQYDAL